jgi:hypothetical protein
MAGVGGESVTAATAGAAGTLVTAAGSETSAGATGMSQGAATSVIPGDSDPSTIEEYTSRQ